MEQTSRAELFAHLRQEVLDSMQETQRLVRELNEEFERSKRREREITSYYRERRLQRLLRSEAW